MLLGTIKLLGKQNCDGCVMADDGSRDVLPSRVRCTGL
jgi:hypothetical protein